jgi:hypothetical protein
MIGREKENKHKKKKKKKERKEKEKKKKEKTKKKEIKKKTYVPVNLSRARGNHRAEIIGRRLQSERSDRKIPAVARDIIVCSCNLVCRLPDTRSEMRVSNFPRHLICGMIS